MTGHVHAELMAQYAEDARETVAPWKQWEVQDLIALQSCVDGWRTCDTHPGWSQKNKYRRKPKTSRERFDEWATQNNFRIDTGNDASYEDYVTSYAWDAWQESKRQALELDK